MVLSPWTAITAWMWGLPFLAVAARRLQVALELVLAA